MSIDDATMAQLQERGALVGFSNADEWARMIAKHGMGAVCFAIGKVRASLGRQPSWKQVEEELPRAAAAQQDAIARAAQSRPTESTPIAEELVHHDDQVEEHPPAPAPKRQPATERKRNRPIDWTALLREFPGVTITELATRAGGERNALKQWLFKHRAEIRCSDTQPRRYWLKDDQRAPATAAAIDPTPPPPAEPDEAVTIATGDDRSISGLGTFACDLDGDLAGLIKRLIDAYADHHEVEILPKPQRALALAVEAVFPGEGA